MNVANNVKKPSLFRVYWEQLKTNDKLFIYLVPLLFSFLNYPFLFLGLQNPMLQYTWELQDPVVSALSFMPGDRVIQFELLHHFQLLWSNLKNLGTPLLANEVQSSPLFPLTLLLRWIPDVAYYNVLAVAKLYLIGLAQLLIARRHFHFSKLASLMMTLCFAYSLFVMRWMNHSYMLGFLAAIWCFYFLLENFERRNDPWDWSLFLRFAGLVLSAYSMVACGFPEATALMGLVLLLFGIVYLPLHAKSFKGIGLFFLRTTLAAVIGVGLASIQIFALSEYISFDVDNFRKNIGLAQYTSWKMLFNFVTQYGKNINEINGENNLVTVHQFHLIPLFFFFIGLFSFNTWKKYKKLMIPALFLIIFWSLKLFPVWPFFNNILGSLPVLNLSHFEVYFLPCCLLGFAIIASVGTEEFILRLSQKQIKSLIPHFIIVLMIFFYGLHLAEKIQHFAWIRALIVFCIFFIWLFRSLHRRHLSWVLTFVGCLTYIEYLVSTPRTFTWINKDDYFNSFYRVDTKKVIGQILETQKADKFELRDRTMDMLILGVATPDNGASAILTTRAHKLRSSLFKTDWSGYMPFQLATYPYSWDLVSGNISLIPSQIPMDDLRNLNHGTEWKGPEVWGVYRGFNVVYDKGRLPRSYVTNNCNSVKEMDEALKVLTTNYQLGLAVVENPTWDCKPSSESIRPAKILDDQGSFVQVSAEGPGTLVLHDTYYTGWKAFADNLELSIQPTNLNFRSVYLPEKRTYIVDFKYSPPWWNKYVLLFFLSLLLFFVTLPPIWTRLSRLVRMRSIS